MSKVRVPVFGTVGKSVNITPNATIGAQLGFDLFDEEGRLLTLNSLTDLIEKRLVRNDETNEVIFEEQIVDGTILARLADNETVTGNWTFDTPIQFTPQAAPTHTEGLLWYDSTEKAISYYNDEADVTVNVGQENLIRVRNVSGALIANGAAVYISGATGANLPNISLAQADTLGTAECIGLATHDIEDNSNGYVTTLGIVRDLNTSGFTAGDEIFLSPSVAGAWTATKPTSDYCVPIGYVTVVNPSVGEVKVTMHPEADRGDLTSKSQNETITGQWNFLDRIRVYGGTPYFTIDHDGTDATFTLSASGQFEFSHGLFVDALGSNTDPGADNARFDGYGMMTNRTTSYITNFNAAGEIEVHLESVHGGNRNFLFSTIGNRNEAALDVAGDLTIEAGNSLFLYGLAGVKNVEFVHDDTDFNLTLNSTTDWNITGGGNYIFTNNSKNTYLKSHVTGDYFPYLELQREGGSTKTNQRWDLVIGTPGNMQITNATTGNTPLILNQDAGNSLVTLGVATVTVSGALSATGAVTGSNLNISNWDTAFGWGDHSVAGYAPTASPTFTGTIDVSGATFTGLSSDDLSDVLSIAMLDENESVAGTWNFTGEPTFYSGGASGSLSVGRDASQALTINVTDGVVTQTYVQDEVDATNHSMWWNIDTSGTGLKSYSFRVGNVEKVGWDKDGNLTAQGTVAGSNLNVTNWDTAYGWGDHSTQNYAVTTGDTFTGAVYMGSGAFFYIRNPANTAFASLSHDAVDFNLRFSGSTDFNVDFGSDLTGQIKVFADTHYVSGSAVQIRDATNSKTVTMSHDGDFSFLGSSTTNFDFQGATNMRLLAGIDLKIYDSSSQDIITITHTGAVGQMYTNSTTGGDLHLGAGGTTQILTVDTGSYITVEGTMFLEEQASPKTNVANYGQFWVKTETPNVAYFTDDADNDWPVAGNGISGNGIVKYKDTDTSRSTTTVLADDPDLAGWNLEADTIYMIEAALWFESASSTPDFAYAFQFSNTPQSSKLVRGTTPGDDITSTRSVSLTGGAQDGYNLVAYFHTNATTGGTIDFQWAQLNSDATATILNQGSWMRITKLGVA